MHPEILSIALFWFVAAFTPGPNNVVASYSGFNFGITKTIPLILGVTLGFTSLIFFLTIGLINVFKIFPILQNILKYLGTLFLLYLAYKISLSKSSKEEEKKNPVTFFDTYFFQFLNPKGVLFGIIIVSTYLELGENYLSYAIQIVLLAFIFSSTSITLWTFIGKFLRKFATNDKFINYFNYAMSLLLLLSIVTIYI
ncbi:LysE family translocator [Candidatus Pelagibacter sp. RS40]|uniref:LysE family translocator n=1 Tax=Candidatus Pelagibacter sp. RS40 TaxID=1977865 RepID=UPI000A157758|nr:LysE family transporter [Candidatus Pelagibacter sp. RS40]ARJ49415.1 threonine transporter RhtB [Candidatus Pelagibacter sp. RS40]